MSTPENNSPRRQRSSGAHRAMRWLAVLALVDTALLPGLWWAAADGPFLFRIDLFIVMTIASVVAAGLIFGLLARFGTRGVAWALGMAPALMLVIFQWHVLTRGGREVARAVTFPLVADLVPVALGVALLWLAVRRAGEAPYTAILATLLTVWVVGLGLVVSGLRAPALAQPSSASIGEGPNALVLVLDAYPRNDFALSQFGHDNTAFTAALADRGFAVASSAAANYPFTWASLSAMMQLDYVFPEGPVLDRDKATMRSVLSGERGLMTQFDQAGYETVFHQNGWGGSSCGRTVDICVRRGLIERGVWNLGQLSPLAPVLDAVWPAPITTNSKTHLEKLPEIIAANSSTPRFTFAHLIIPHEPFVYNEECDIDRPTSNDYEAGPHPIVRQLQCVNRLALEAVDAMIEAHPDAVIMITGDHGSIGHIEAAEQGFTPRMATLSAYRLPGCEAPVPLNVSPVNGSRLVANCALDADLEPLPDRHFWLTGKGFIEITDVLRGSQ